MSAPSSSVLEELAAIKAYIGAACDIVKDGYIPDMAALEKRISDVCLAIQAAEREEQGRYLSELAALLKSLNECERAMRDWNDAQTQKASETR